MVDIETGNTAFELAVPQSVVVLNPQFAIASTTVVNAAIDAKALIVVSAAQEVLSVDLNARTLRWKTPLPNKKVASLRMLAGRVYAGTESGELLALDGATGAVLSTTKLSPRKLTVDYAARDLIVASADTAIFGVDASGHKRWEYPSTLPAKSVQVFKGVIAARTSSTQITTLDARTGEVLWQHEGEPADSVFITDTAFFIVENRAIREFSTDLATREDHRPSDKEVLVELAAALESKGMRDEANSYIDQLKEIDPDYPPLRLLLGDFATYANLVGRKYARRSKSDCAIEEREGPGLGIGD